MFSQTIKTDYKKYHTASVHKEVTTNNPLSFDVHIQLGDKKSWKNFKALLDIESYASLCLTESQAKGLLLLPPQESEIVHFYAERKSLWNQPIELDTYVKVEHPVAISVEVFLPEKQEEKKKFSSYCSVLHIMCNYDAKKFNYRPENDEILLGRQFLDHLNVDIEYKDLQGYNLAFNVPQCQELPDWTPNV